MNMRHPLHIIAILLLLLVAALAGGMSLSQEEDAEDAQDEAQAVPILEFGTYDCKWLRYINYYPNGGRKIAIEGLSEFPYRYVVSEDRPALHDLEAADTLAEQLAQYGVTDESALAYDEERLDGACDTERLGGYYPDVFCVPGTSVMPDGRVSLALYHPENFEIVALTTSIDNRSGGATDAGCWRPPTPEPAPQPQPASTAQAPQDASPGCGPYAPGQWISAEDYDASGLNLPISTEKTQFPIIVYVCEVPQGAPSYLQAHPLIQPTPTATPVEQRGGGGSDDGGSGDDDDDDNDDNGPVNCETDPFNPNC